jgi:hypothetical protein
MRSSTPTIVKTTPAHTTTPMESKPCQPSPLTLWSAHPLALHPPYAPLRPLHNPSPQGPLRTWWPSTNMTVLPSTMWPKDLLPPSESEKRDTLPTESLLLTKYKT